MISTTWFEVCMKYECKSIDFPFNGTNYLTTASFNKKFYDKLVEHDIIEFEEFLFKAGYVSWIWGMGSSLDINRIFTWGEPRWENTPYGLARVNHGSLHHMVKAIRFSSEEDRPIIEYIREVMEMNTDESERLLKKFTSGRRFTLTPYNYGFTFFLFKILFIVVFFPIYLPILMLSDRSTKITIL